MSHILFAATAILLAAAAPTVGDTYIAESTSRVYQAALGGTATAASVAIEVSLNGKDFLQLAVIELDSSSSGAVTDGFASQAPWRFVRARVLSISGGGTVSAYAGV